MAPDAAVTDRELRELNSRLSSAFKDLNDLLGRVEHISAAIAPLQSDITAIKSVMMDSSTNPSILSRLHSLEKQVAEAQKSMEDLENDLKTARTALDSLLMDHRQCVTKLWPLIEQKTETKTEVKEEPKGLNWRKVTEAIFATVIAAVIIGAFAKVMLLTIGGLEAWIKTLAK